MKTAVTSRPTNCEYILTLINLRALSRAQGQIPVPVADRRHGEQRGAAEQRAQYVYRNEL
jgi:hypothetical protein